MEIALYPKYNDFFEPTTASYDELLVDMPSKEVTIVLLKICDLIKKEVNELEILESVIKNLQQNEKQYFRERYKIFKRDSPIANCFFFNKYHILAMIAKEGRRNRVIEIDETKFDWFKMLKAYLLLCDEVSSLKEQIDDTNWHDKNMWAFNWSILIDQFEIGERVCPIYDKYRFIVLVMQLSNDITIIEEFLKSMELETINDFWKVFINVQIELSNSQGNEEKFQDYFEVPIGKFSIYLRRFCINDNYAKLKGRLSDLKLYPLYRLSETRFYVIDYTLFSKKIYKEFLFSVWENTSLITKYPKFPDFKNFVSKEISEKYCFGDILISLIGDTATLMKLDDGSDGIPDLYVRIREKVFIIEFKDYLFPDNLLNNPAPEKISKYIDERFLESDSNKPKGVKQLASFVNRITSGNSGFDIGLDKRISNKQKISVYPIICYTEYNFSMPGITDYLNIHLNGLITRYSGISVAPLNMVNLKVFLDLYLRGKTMKNFIKLQNQFFTFKTKGLNDKIKGHSIGYLTSFEEYYDIVTQSSNDNPIIMEKVKSLLSRYPNMNEVFDYRIAPA